MRINFLEIGDYWTLESIELEFPFSFPAICRANDRGTTNMRGAIRALGRGKGPDPVFLFPEQENLSLKDDCPKWEATEPTRRRINLDLSLPLDNTDDISSHQFAAKQSSVDDTAQSLDISIRAKCEADGT